MRRLRAQFVFCSPDRVLAPGEVEIDRAGRVRSLRRLTRGTAPPIAVFPGLVNAHAHLQLDPLPQRRPPRRFLPWVRAVMAQRVGRTPEQDRDRARRGLEELLADGCTAVGEIDSTGHSPAVLRSLPLAGRCYRELTGFHLDARGARKLLADRAAPGSRRAPAAWSPHAPYSVSPALMRAARRSGRPLSIHVAEVPEEQEFLHRGRGPFAELLESLGRLPAGFRAPGVGAVEHLDRHGLLAPHCSLVHCQHLEPGDAERIARRAAPVVVCPRTIRWFRRDAPPVPAWLNQGVSVALGTDSLASSEEHSLSMRAEMEQARRLWPQLAPRTVFAMATTAGARALARPGLGRLFVGGAADCVVVSAVTAGAGGRKPSADVLLDAFTAGEAEVLEALLLGRSAV